MTNPMDDLRQASADVSGVEVLSDAALNVWCAFCGVVEDHGPPRLGLAAALRAAANLERQSPWLTSIEGCSARWMRDQILAIAAELEGADG